MEEVTGDLNAPSDVTKEWINLANITFIRVRGPLPVTNKWLVEIYTNQYGGTAVIQKNTQSQANNEADDWIDRVNAL
jgi:hypothetical protein